MTQDDLINVLSLIRPGAEWLLQGTTLVWLDKIQVQPTDAELQIGLTQFQANQTAQNQALANAQAVLKSPAAVLNPDPRVDALITLFKTKGII